MYKIYRKLDNGEFVAVATCQQVEEAKRIVRRLSGFWPGEYVVRDAASGDLVARQAILHAA